MQRASAGPAARVGGRVARERAVRDRCGGCLAKDAAAAHPYTQVPGSARRSIGQSEPTQDRAVRQIDTANGSVPIGRVWHLPASDHGYGRAVGALHRHRFVHRHPVGHRPIHRPATRGIDAVAHPHQRARHRGRIHRVLDGPRGRGPRKVGRHRVGADGRDVMHPRGDVHCRQRVVGIHRHRRRDGAGPVHPVLLPLLEDGPTRRRRCRQRHHPAATVGAGERGGPVAQGSIVGGTNRDAYPTARIRRSHAQEIRIGPETHLVHPAGISARALGNILAVGPTQNLRPRRHRKVHPRPIHFS